MICLYVKSRCFYGRTDTDKWRSRNREVWDSNRVPIGCEAVFLTHWHEAYSLATLWVTEFETILKYRCGNPLKRPWIFKKKKKPAIRTGTVSSLLWNSSCVRLLCALQCRIYNCFYYFRSACNKFPSVIPRYSNSACDTSHGDYSISPFSHRHILWDLK